ncbi:hypothetical protein [Ideonella oryzae]|uniref:Polyprenyl synthetase n=1 Tax=Ideonella oryzae TaxID=2937441 RepID=A0ABT1BG69_9BURK|nr:hypothetical protein [Ideonella oryzae]MCO5975235.1 hypothetical protein [Ideonella oryzae]
MTPKYPESLLPRIRAQVQDTLTCQAETVQLALEMHFAQRLGALRGLLACCLGEGQAAMDVGVALDLVHVSLQRLHVRLEDGTGVPAMMGTGACVLAGDYLTSAAFKVLIRCRDLAVLDRVARTITHTCEQDNRVLEADSRGRSRDRRRAALDLALAGVAAEAGAILSGQGELARPARRLGLRLQALHALTALVEHSEADEAEGYRWRAQRALAGAQRAARRLDARLNPAPGLVGRAAALVAFVEQALHQPKPALA